MSIQRTNEFSRDKEYDMFLREMNCWLAAIEKDLTAGYERPRKPVLFVVGPPRSGTTLVTQLLAATNCFAYPSNLLARFYQNLYVGFRIETLLKNVLPPKKHSFTSNIVRTSEWFSPNEFGFFWDLYFPLREHHEVREKDLDDSKMIRFLREIAAFEAISGRPVFMKGMIMNYNLPLLYRLLPQCLFVRMTRPYVSLVDSILDSRRRFCGSTHFWLSCKPRNWRQLASLEDPIEQVVSQVHSIESALNLAFETIPLENHLTISYPELCSTPAVQINRIEKKLNHLSCEIEIPANFPVFFEESRKHVEDKDTETRIAELCRRYKLFPGMEKQADNCTQR